MAKKINLLPLLPKLTENERQGLNLCGIHPFTEAQRAINTLFEAGREYRAAYTTIARKLQGLLPEARKLAGHLPD